MQSRIENIEIEMVPLVEAIEPEIELNEVRIPIIEESPYIAYPDIFECLEIIKHHQEKFAKAKKNKAIKEICQDIFPIVALLLGSLYTITRFNNFPSVSDLGPQVAALLPRLEIGYVDLAYKYDPRIADFVLHSNVCGEHKFITNPCLSYIKPFNVTTLLDGVHVYNCENNIRAACNFSLKQADTFTMITFAPIALCMLFALLLLIRVALKNKRTHGSYPSEYEPETFSALPEEAIARLNQVAGKYEIQDYDSLTMGALLEKFDTKRTELMDKDRRRRSFLSASLPIYRNTNLHHFFTRDCDHRVTELIMYYADMHRLDRKPAL